MQLTRSIASYMKDAGKGCCLVEGPHLTIWGAAQEATPHCIKQRATRLFLPFFFASFSLVVGEAQLHECIR